MDNPLAKYLVFSVFLEKFHRNFINMLAFFSFSLFLTMEEGGVCFISNVELGACITACFEAVFTNDVTTRVSRPPRSQEICCFGTHLQQPSLYDGAHMFEKSLSALCSLKIVIFIISEVEAALFCALLPAAL